MLIKLFSMFLIAVQQSDIFIHDIREDENSEEKHEAAEELLQLRDWMVVTEADGGERCEGKVKDVQGCSF